MNVNEAWARLMAVDVAAALPTALEVLGNPSHYDEQDYTILDEARHVLVIAVMVELDRRGVELDEAEQESLRMWLSAGEWSGREHLTAADIADEWQSLEGGN